VVEDGEPAFDQVGGRGLPYGGEAFLVAGTLGRMSELLR
jgi:hypothetical protein